MLLFIIKAALIHIFILTMDQMIMWGVKVLVHSDKSLIITSIIFQVIVTLTPPIASFFFIVGKTTSNKNSAVCRLVAIFNIFYFLVNRKL